MWELILKNEYSIQDFNATIEGGFSGKPKDVVYLIVLAIDGNNFLPTHWKRLRTNYAQEGTN